MAERVKAHAASIDAKVAFEKVGTGATEALERARRQAAPQLAQAKETALNIANQQAKSFAMVNAKTLLNSRASYGVPLDAVSFRDIAGTVLHNPKVPTVVELLLSRLEETTADRQLFLATPNAGAVRALVKAIDADAESADAAAEIAAAEPRVAAAAFRSWLLELPEPLLTCEHYEAIVEAGLQPDSGEQLRSAVSGIPRQNWITAQRCLIFLAQAAQTCDDVPALALALGPALLRPKKREASVLRAIMEDLPAICDVTEALFRHAPAIFAEPPQADAAAADAPAP